MARPTGTPGGAAVSILLFIAAIGLGWVLWEMRKEA
jgi:hypothetical protein